MKLVFCPLKMKSSRITCYPISYDVLKTANSRFCSFHQFKIQIIQIVKKNNHLKTDRTVRTYSLTVGIEIDSMGVIPLKKTYDEKK